MMLAALQPQLDSQHGLFMTRVITACSSGGLALGPSSSRQQGLMQS